jgi:hypothetical protein
MLRLCIFVSIVDLAGKWVQIKNRQVKVDIFLAEDDKNYAMTTLKKEI